MNGFMSGSATGGAVSNYLRKFLQATFLGQIKNMGGQNLLFLAVKFCKQISQHRFHYLAKQTYPFRTRKYDLLLTQLFLDNLLDNFKNLAVNLCLLNALGNPFQKVTIRIEILIGVGWIKHES